MAQEQDPTVIGGLLKAVGGWTTYSGKGLHMFRAMTFCASCAAASGVASAFLCSLFFGPVGAIAFAIGSSLGWTAAAFYGWQSSLQHALVAYDQYPRLMVRHMERSFRLMRLERVNLATADEVGKFRGRIMREVQMKCMLVAAYETAQPLIDEIEARREARLVAELVDGEE